MPVFFAPPLPHPAGVSFFLKDLHVFWTLKLISNWVSCLLCGAFCSPSSFCRYEFIWLNSSPLFFCPTRWCRWSTLMPWWSSSTPEKTRPSTCPAFGPPELRERYKQTSVSVSVCLYVCSQICTEWVAAHVWIHDWMCWHSMWESLWSSMVGQLIRSSTETTGVTAVSDVSTELVYFHLNSNTSCLHLPPQIPEYLSISLSLMPSSLPSHTSLAARSLNDRGNNFDHLVAPLQLGHMQTQWDTCTHPVVAALQRVR